MWLKKLLCLFSVTLLFLHFIVERGLQAAEPTVRESEKGDMVLIPAGEFLMGMKDGDPLGLVWTTPQRKVNLPGYYIDKFTVTNKEYKKFVDATGHRAPHDKKHGTIYSWKDNMYTENLDDHPVVLVNWFDAEAYCKWAGKKLPTEAEWEKAARGTDGRLWPWGNEYERIEFPGIVTMANTYSFRALITMPVGSFPEGASPYGVMDMAGNVFEWTSSWFKGYPGSKWEHPLYGEKYKVSRGGGFMSPADPFSLTISRSSLKPEHKHRTTGFRCAKSKAD